MDSVAFQFRVDFNDYAKRSRILNSIAQRLTQLAIERQVAGGYFRANVTRAQHENAACQCVQKRKE